MKGRVSYASVGGGKARTHSKQRRSIVKSAFQKDRSGFGEGHKGGGAGGGMDHIGCSHSVRVGVKAKSPAAARTGTVSLERRHELETLYDVESVRPRDW